MTYQELLKLRADHLSVQHGISFYEYQRIVSDRIIYALLHNLSITSNSTPKDIEKLVQYEIAIEMSRQSGKTWAVGHTGEFILTYLPVIFNRPLQIGIFATQLDQAKISYNILRNGLRKAKAMMLISKEQQQFINEEENARKLVLPDGSSVIVAPISKTSMIEGPKLDLIIIDEAQLADDEIVKHSIWPMGKSTNAPRVYIGKAGTRINHFYRLSQKANSIKFYFDEVTPMRRQLYEETRDARHLIYEQSVKQDIATYGRDAPEIQREYFGQWQIGTGQFTTQEELLTLETDRAPTNSDKTHNCFVGIDTAKHPDSTVVTVIRENKPEEIAKGAKRKSLISWLELRGDNYQDQFDIILDYLQRYKVTAVAIDSTGQGDFMPDMFERHSPWMDENTGLYRVKFSSVNKDLMFKNLKVSIKELLTDLPKLSTTTAERFKQQLLDLQQEYKGQLLSVSHPDDPNAHDDYPDSWALAEWAFALWNQTSKATVTTVTLNEKERKVKKDSEGKTTDYWPGADW